MTLFVLLRSSLAVTFVVLLLTGCDSRTSPYPSKQAEVEARQKAELAARQQAEQAQRTADELRDRLKTLRIVAFVALAGVAVAVLAWAGRSSSRAAFDDLPAGPLPVQRPTHPSRLVNDLTRSRGEGRIIELPPHLRSPGAPQPAATPAATPTAAVRKRRRRRRNHRPGDLRYNPHQPPNRPPATNDHETPPHC